METLPYVPKRAFMNLGDRLNAINNLSEYIDSKPDELTYVILKSCQENKWFTEENYNKALDSIRSEYFDGGKLKNWVSQYALNPPTKKIGLIQAGNIPLVGIHDILAIFMSGHTALIKCSSRDAYVLPHLINILCQIDDRVKDQVVIVDKLEGHDAIIATGSNSSTRHFEYYFKKYPKILRGHRNGVAVLDGHDSMEALEDLGLDVFTHFGLGCRNVSKILVPDGYDFNSLACVWKKYKKVMDNQKYRNNYDYNLATFTLNVEPFLDLGCILLKDNPALHSRIATLHYEYYTSQEHLLDILQRDINGTQCIISNTSHGDFKSVPFGKSQSPDLLDYADGIDTMAFLTSTLTL